MQLAELSNHLVRGGAAILGHPATYRVAEGAVIAPARYARRDSKGAEFVFERRFIDGRFASTTLIDSKGAQSNRGEDGLTLARAEGEPFDRIPVISVEYSSRTLLDLELPHRAVDAHIRAAAFEGKPVVEASWYRAIRDATMADLSPLFTRAPAMLAYGGWDSTRKRGQLRLRSQYVSELFAVVDEDERRLSRRSGARLDPLGQDFQLTPDEFEHVLEVQRSHLSEDKVTGLEKSIANARKKGETVSASPFVIGGIPPGLENAYGVSVPEVRRARTYSLAGLRRLRFGGSAAEDQAARAALLAMLLLGAALSDADPDIRAYCDVSSPRGRVLLDDEEVDVDLSIDSCADFLSHAIAALPERLAWTGQVTELVGDPALDRGAIADSAGDEA